MKEPDIITEHTAENGDKYTREIYSSGAAAWHIIKDAQGREIPQGGSGGYMPWESRPKQ